MLYHIRHSTDVCVTSTAINDSLISSETVERERKFNQSKRHLIDKVTIITQTVLQVIFTCMSIVE